MLQIGSIGELLLSGLVEHFIMLTISSVLGYSLTLISTTDPTGPMFEAHVLAYGDT